MTNWSEQIEWDDLLDDIRNQKCVLIIGPDLISFENQQTLFQVLSQQLVQDAKLKDHVDLSPQYIFEHEELLQLKPGKRDNALFRFYRAFYESQTEFDEPFAKIAQMPFHLIISLLPDERLSAIFGKMGRDYQFDYYAPVPPNSLDKTPDVEPTRNKPLIYNIIGTLERNESVITFDHLFNYLQGILGSRPLPVQLVKTLKEAESFLFLGVHFEKWYMQVLLRMFVPRGVSSDGNKISKYSLLQAGQADDVSTFIARRLELDFLEIEPLDFLNELYRHLSEGKLLINPTKSTVFLSYSHADSVWANQVVDALKKARIAVIRDEESMPVGQRISRFMEQVKTVDALVVIVSEGSLHSPFVGKEILHALDNSIRLIPAYLDKKFLESDIGQKVHTGNNEQLQIIQDAIAARKNINRLDLPKDLEIEEKLRQEFGLNLGTILGALKDAKEISLQEPDAETGIQRIIHEVLNRR